MKINKINSNELGAQYPFPQKNKKAVDTIKKNINNIKKSMSQPLGGGGGTKLDVIA
ncbi:MAG: hypothetical protein ACOC1K_04595 [Nanoarchaeota archaeon]